MGLTGVAGIGKTGKGLDGSLRIAFRVLRVFMRRGSVRFSIASILLKERGKLCCSDIWRDGGGCIYGAFYLVKGKFNRGFVNRVGIYPLTSEVGFLFNGI